MLNQGILSVIFLFLTVFNCNSQSFDNDFFVEKKKHFEEDWNCLDPIEGVWKITSLSKVYFKNELQLAVKDSTEYYIFWNPELSEFNMLGTWQTFSGISHKVAADWFTLRIMDQNTYVIEIKNDGRYGNSLILKQDVIQNSFTADFVARGSDFTQTISISASRHIPSITNYEQGCLAMGTCFAISDNLFLTSFHTIKGKQKISIRGLQGNPNERYQASVLCYDESFDLAILELNDTLIQLNGLPLDILSAELDVGTDVFCLGYPLVSSMGYEIKLTNGIISSRSGYMGDTTHYQSTTAVQPGNSGGPMFSLDGKVSGIISAKHYSAENASYIIKSTIISKFLKQCILVLDTEPRLNLSKEDLVDQVRILKKYVFIIEAR